VSVNEALAVAPAVTVTLCWHSGMRSRKRSKVSSQEPHSRTCSYRLHRCRGAARYRTPWPGYCGAVELVTRPLMDPGSRLRANEEVRDCSAAAGLTIGPGAKLAMVL